MLLSLVTGTYNRLPFLRAMLESAEKSIPRGIAWEICVCDGGSTDGTLEYLREKLRVRLVEHGELKGGIAAFNDAARVATGDYLCIANDDIEFKGFAIAAGLARIMDEPDIGAVAFYQDRNGKEMHVESMPMRDADGKEHFMPYLQVGIIPRFLWEACGGWGNWGGRTYGGDNYLSMQVYGRGYRIVPMKECEIHDKTPMDALRARNTTQNDDGRILWEKFHDMPIASAPTIPNPLPQRKRVLYTPIIEDGHDVQKLQKHGLCQALTALGEVMECDYVYSKENILGMAKAWQPHYILTQFHEADEARVKLTEELKKIRREWMINWNGDVWEKSQTDPNYMAMLRNFDCHTCVNAALFPLYEEKGIRADYWQNSFEPMVVIEDAKLEEDAPRSDVVFLGNNYSPYRLDLVERLKALPFDVRIFGRGYPEGVASGESLYNFQMTGAVYRKARIAIADNQFYEAVGFASDRMFMALAAGGCMLMHQRVQKMEELLGLKDGVHYVAWDGPTDREQKIRYYLEHEDERKKIADAGTLACRTFHTYEKRVEELQRLVEKIKPNHRRISVCIIVKNERGRLANLIEQLDWAHEIVVVDTGSDDGTPEALMNIAHFEHEPPEVEGKQRRVLRYMKWQDDFSKARNYAKKFCTMEWVFWLDADDILDKNFRGWMAKFPTKEWKNHTAQAFMFPCVDSKTGQFVMQARLFRNLEKVGWQNPIHETVNDSLKVLGIRPVGFRQLKILHVGNQNEADVIRKQVRNLKILQQQPPSPWRSYHMASGLAAMGLYGSAIPHLEQALMRGLDGQGAPRAMQDFLRFFLGYCLDQSGETTEARAHLLQSNYPDAKYLLADMDDRAGKPSPTLYHAYLKADISTDYPSFSGTWIPIARQKLEDFVRGRIEEWGWAPKQQTPWKEHEPHMEA